jgi:hypothetical protein
VPVGDAMIMCMIFYGLIRVVREVKDEGEKSSISVI